MFELFAKCRVYLLPFLLLSFSLSLSLARSAFLSMRATMRVNSVIQNRWIVGIGGFILFVERSTAETWGNTSSSPNSTRYVRIMQNIPSPYQTMMRRILFEERDSVLITCVCVYSMNTYVNEIYINLIFILFFFLRLCLFPALPVVSFHHYITYLWR